MARNPRKSTADLLTWSETPPPPSDSPSADSSARRTNKPAGKISAVMFGAQMSKEEAESELKRKPCSTPKLKEITGSGIFADGENGGSVEPINASARRNYQQAVSGISQISFGADGSVSPKKPVSIPEVAKQRELSGNMESESDAKSNKQLSDAKCRELSGHDIFGPPPEVPARPLAARNLALKGNLDFGEPPRNLHTSVKVSNPSGGPSNIVFSDDAELPSTKKIHNQKFAELTGNNIFKGDVPPGSAEKPLSNAKLREMNGSNIFADGKASSREYFGGVRKPPGGSSSISLV